MRIGLLIGLTLVVAVLVGSCARIGSEPLTNAPSEAVSVPTASPATSPAPLTHQQILEQYPDGLDEALAELDEIE